MKENWTYRRGDIYLANLNPYIGSEQGGTRPVLLLQNNTGNFYCPTLIKNQLQEDYTDDQLSIKEFIDPFTGEPVRGGK